MKRILNFPRSPLFAAMLTLGALGPSEPSVAANLLTNSSFDSDLSGWALGPQVSWTDQGNLNRGAARVAGTPGIVGQTVLSQCVAVEAGSHYDLGASILIPYSPTVSGGASLRVTWFGTPRCDSAPLTMSPTLEFPYGPPIVWTRRSLERLRAPLAASSASISVVAYSGGTPGAFGMSLDEIQFSPSPRYETLVIPTAASIDGALGERFRTSLIIKNPSSASRRIGVSLRCRNDQPCSSANISLFFNPGETRVFSDAMFEIFGKRNFAGAFEIGYEGSYGPIVVSARAMTVHEARPGNGMALPVLKASSARISGVFSGLVDPRGGEGSVRVNAGAYNPNDAYIWVNYALYGPDGTYLDTVLRLAAPYEWFQINDIFSAAGVGAPAEGSFVRVLSEAPVHPFLISIDNRSGDPSWIEVKEDFQP